MENLRTFNFFVVIFFLLMFVLAGYYYKQYTPLSAIQNKALKTNPIAYTARETTAADSVKKPEKTLDKRPDADVFSPQTQHRALRLQVNGVLYEGYRVNLDEDKIAFYYQDAKGKNLKNLGGLKNYLDGQRIRLKFATNAGIFTPAFRPNGLYVEDGQEKVALNLKKGKGNFYMRPNGVFFITRYGSANIIPSHLYPRIAHLVTYATQSGPLLLLRGRINPKFNYQSTNKYTRSGVGVIDKQNLVFIISRQPVTLYEFAKLFRDQFQCTEALYLDGTISKIYAPALKRYETQGNFGAMIAIIQK